MASNRIFPQPLQLAPQIPTPPAVPPVKTWRDIGDAFFALFKYLRILVQFLSNLLGQYATDINLSFGAQQTAVSTAVSLPDTATTLIGTVTFQQLVALAQGDFISMAVQGVIDASKSFNVIVRGVPSGVQISGLPNATVTSDGSGNFHFSDSNTVPAGMIGDTGLKFYIAQSTGGGLTLTTANLGSDVRQTL
jgi:hypothetical protein